MALKMETSSCIDKLTLPDVMASTTACKTQRMHCSAFICGSTLEEEIHYSVDFQTDRVQLAGTK